MRGTIPPAGPGPKLTDHIGCTPTDYRGALSEYLAASWYLGRGIPVYWPAVQQDGCDLVIHDPERGLQRVQVKTARLYNGKSWRTDVGNTAEYDVLHVVGPGGEHWRLPASYLHGRRTITMNDEMRD